MRFFVASPGSCSSSSADPSSCRPLPALTPPALFSPPRPQLLRFPPSKTTQPERDRAVQSGAGGCGVGGRGPGTPAVPSTSLPPPPSPSGSGFLGQPPMSPCPLLHGEGIGPVPAPALTPGLGVPLLGGGSERSPRGCHRCHPRRDVACVPLAMWGASPGPGQPGTRVAPGGGRGGDSGDRRLGAAAGGGASVPLSPVPSALSCLLPAPLRWRCGWAQYECFVLLSSSSSSSSHRLVPSPCLQPSESNSPTSGRAGPRNTLRGAAVPAGVGG